jgi:multidrug efflux pump subunit AcrA (membrane-fusion protein)
LNRRSLIAASKQVLSVASIALLCCVTGCDIESSASSSIAVSAVKTPLKVKVLTVDRVEVATETVVFYGTLVPVRESRMGFESGGTVEKILKVAGDRVVEGDVIALLDQSALHNQQEQIGSSLAQAKQRLRSASRETARPIQQQIAELEAQLAVIEAEVKRRVIVAPFTGIVSAITIQPGEIVAPSLPVVIVVADAPPQIAADLAESMAARVISQKTIWAALGDRAVRFTVKSSSEIRGPIPGRKMVFSVQDELPNDSWTYDDVVELRFRETVDISGAWLPLNAIQKRGEGWYVIVVSPASDSGSRDTFTSERRPVDIRLLQDNRAFVESPLTTGEVVVTDGAHRIVPGQQVTPVMSIVQSMGADEQGAAN